MAQTPAPELAAAERTFRRVVATELDRVLQRGLLAHGLPVSLPLRDIYLDVTLRSEDAGEASFVGTIAAALDAGPPGPLLVVGDAGAGKSTMLRLLALRAAERASGPLPVFLPLAACDELLAEDPSRSLVDLAALHWLRFGAPDLGPVLAQAIAEDRLLLLLDGLDEVLDRPRQALLIGLIEELTRAGSTPGRCIVTSRKLGAHELPPLLAAPRRFELQPLSDEQVRHFAYAWHSTFQRTMHAAPEVAERHATELTDALLAEVTPDAGLAQLARTPLLLTMLIQLRQTLGVLPKHRVEVYHAYVRMLLEQREAVRSDGVTPRPRFDVHAATDHLVELGLQLHLAHPHGTVPRAELERLCEQIVLRYEGYTAPEELTTEQADRIRRRALEFLRDVSQIAGLVVEHGPGVWGFLHWSFQEFFAGRALARMPRDQRWLLLRPHLHALQWRAVILFCAGWLGAVEHRRDELSEFCSQILHAGSRYEELILRDLRLATAILRAHPDLSRRVIEDFVGRFTASLTNVRYFCNLQCGFSGLLLLEKQGVSLENILSSKLRELISTLPDAVLRPVPDLPPLLVEAFRRVPSSQGSKNRALASDEVEALIENIAGSASISGPQLASLYGDLFTGFSSSLWDGVVDIVENHPSIEMAQRAHCLLVIYATLLPPEGLLRRAVVRLDGQRVGILEETPQGSRFTYDAAWLAHPDARPVSLTLRLRQSPYESVGLHPFFENLLPEGWLLEVLSKQQKIDKADRFGVLMAACGETVGAVEIMPEVAGA